MARVNTRWVYGTEAQASAYGITIVVQKTARGWLVDDAYCPNDPSSSIYNSPTGPCPLSSSSGGGVPGMPQTGVGSAPGPILCLLGGLAAALLGLLLIRRGTRLIR